MKKLLLLLLIMPFIFGYTTTTDASSQTVNNETIYKIFVDRFNNGDQTNAEQVDLDNPNAYHGGDIRGIIDKLDFIQDRGFTMISLSPIMENAKGGYHGYWITDYFQVEKQFGTMDNVKELVKKAHQKGIKVLLEFVPNFVAMTHPFASDPDKVVENHLSDKMWLGDAVKLNLENDKVKQTLFKAADFWLNETGVDGLNIHSVEQVPLKVLRQFVEHVKQTKPDIYLTGSILNQDDFTSDYLQAGIPLLDDIPLKREMIAVFSQKGTPVKNIYETWKKKGEQDGLLAVDDKLSKRFTREVVENGQNPLDAWKLALTYMYTTPGVPKIFQGSTIPMDGDTPEHTQQFVQFNHNDQDLEHFYKKLSWIRKKYPVLVDGDFDLVASSGAMSVFKRSNREATMYIAINNDKTSRDVFLTDVPKGMQLSGLLNDNLVRANDAGKYRIGLSHETAEIYLVMPDKGPNWLFIGLISGVFVLFILIIVYLARKKKRIKA